MLRVGLKKSPKGSFLYATMRSMDSLVADICDPSHEERVHFLFKRVCLLLQMEEFELRPLRRRKRGEGKFRSFRLGYTRLDTKRITIDFYTPKTMQPRQTDAILRVICHELAHHQEPPRLYRSGFRLLRRSHHPHFWKRYKQNVELLKQDHVLKEYF